MHLRVFTTSTAMGHAAAKAGAAAIRDSIVRDGKASIIIATGASQFDMLDVLVDMDIDWSRITVFHLDEYVGLSDEHPASFRRYLQERLITRVGSLAAFVPVNGDADDLGAELSMLNARIAAEKIVVCFAGIGENCHLAFNDPPADFDAAHPYIVVSLDEASRRQQMGEGWFVTLDDVPVQAVSMSIPQIMRSEKIIITAPDARKAKAVAAAVEGPVTPKAPASILQRHVDCAVFLDTASAALLARKPEQVE